MALNVNKTNLIIMGVQFDSQKDFKGVWYAISINRIEGWELKKYDVEEMKLYIVIKKEQNPDGISYRWDLATVVLMK